MEFQDILRAILPYAGGAIGGLAGGPAGAAAGSALGTFGSSYMKNRNQSQRYMNPRQQIGSNGSYPQQMGGNPNMMSQQNNMGSQPQQMGGNPNMMSQQYPGGYTAVQTPRFNQQTQGMFDQLGQQGMAGMQNLPNVDFAPIEKEMTSQFYQDVIPRLKEQFTSVGGQRSGAFQQTLGAAGAGLQERLASTKQGFNMQNRGQEISRLMSMLQMGSQPQFDTNFIPPEQSMWGQAAGSLLTGAGAAGMAYLPQLLQYLMKQKNPSTEV